jgi:hypothetical protein
MNDRKVAARSPSFFLDAGSRNKINRSSRSFASFTAAATVVLPVGGSQVSTPSSCGRPAARCRAPVFGDLGRSVVRSMPVRPRRSLPPSGHVHHQTTRPLAPVLHHCPARPGRMMFSVQPHSSSQETLIHFTQVTTRDCGYEGSWSGPRFTIYWCDIGSMAAACWTGR